MHSPLGRVLKKFFGQSGIKQVVKPARNRRSSLQGLELLEDRLVPATFYWDGSANDGSWATLANWSTDIAGGVDPGALPSATDDVIFNANALGTQISTLGGADRAVQSVTFASNVTNPITIAAGNILTIGAGGVTDNAAAAVTFNNALALGAAQSWTNNSSSLLQAAAVSNGANTLTIAGSGNTTITGVLGGGAGDVVMNGTGSSTLTLSNTGNTYAGKTIINSGVVSITNIGNLGANPAAATADQITLNGGTLRLAAAISSVAAWGNRGIMLQSASTINIAHDSVTNTVPGAIAGPGQLTILFTNTGVWNPSTAYTYSGGTVLSFSGTNGLAVPSIASTPTTGTPTSGPFGTGPITFNGGQLRPTTSTSVTIILANPIVFNADTTIPNVTNPRPITFNGNVTLNNSVQLTNLGSTATFGGAVTGTANLTVNAGSANGVIFTGLVNNAGTITNGGASTGTATFSGGIGANVTSVIQNSATSPLTVSTAAIAVNSAGTTLTSTAAGTKLFTVSGGVTGTGNLITNNNSATANGITISTTPVNVIGTITNSGTGAGSVLISGGVGANVPTITENSTTSALTVGAIAVNANGTTLINNNASGSAILTASGGVTGTGNVVLNNNSAIAAGVTLTTAAVNNIGAIINSGTGTGSVTITGGVGANVTTINENAAASALTVSTNALAINSAGTTLNNNSTGAAILTVSGGVTGTGNLVLNNNGATAGGVIVSIANNIGTVTNSGAGAGSSTLTFGANVTAVTENSATSPLTIGATSAVNSAGTTISNTNSSGSAILTIGANINGTGNLILNNNSAINGGITISTTTSFSMVGQVINSGTGSGSVNTNNTGGFTASVTGVLQNSSTSALVLNTNNNAYTSGVTINGTAPVIAMSASSLGSAGAKVKFNVAGTLDLRSDSTVTYTSGIDTTVSGGTIVVSRVTAGNGTTPVMSGANALGAGTLVLRAGGNVNADTGYGLSLTGANTLNANSTYTINGNGAATGTLNLTGGFNTLGASPSLTFNPGTGVAAAVIGGAFSGAAGTLVIAGTAPVTVGTLTTSANKLRIDGSSVYTFSGASTFTGGVVLNNSSATYQVTNGGTGTSSGLGFGGMTKFNQPNITLELRAAGTVFSTGIDTTAFGGAVLVNRPTASATATTHTFNMPNALGSNTLTVQPGSNITGSAAATLVLSGATSLSGNAILSVNSSGTVSQTLTLAGITGAGSITATGSGSITQTAPWDNANGSASLTLDSAFSGAFTLSQVNTFDGGITVNAGRLVSTAADSWNGNVQVNPNGILWLQVNDATNAPTDTITLNGGMLLAGVTSISVSVNRNLTVTADSTLRVTRNSTTATPGGVHTLGSLSIGSQTLTIDNNSTSSIPGTQPATTGTTGFTFLSTTLTGSPNFVISNPAVSGTTTLNLGAVNLVGGSRTLTTSGTGALTLTGALSASAANSTLTVNGSTNATFTNVLAGSNNPNLDIAGTGVYSLSGTNTYLGATTIDSGAVTASGSLASASVTINGGVVTASGTMASTNTTLNGGALVITANSTLTNGAITSSPIGVGTFTVNGGLLKSDATPRTILNQTVLGGDFTIDEPTNGRITFDPTATNGGSITVNGGVHIAQLGALAATFIGPIAAGSGMPALTLTGPGNYIFRNNTGAAGTLPSVVINGGIAFTDGNTVADVQNAFGNATVTVNNGGTLGYLADLSLTPTTPIIVTSGGNILYRPGNGAASVNVLTLSPTYVTLPTAGVVSFDRDNGNDGGSIVVQNNFPLTGDLTLKVGNDPLDPASGSTPTVRFDGVISNGFNLTKTGHGLATLTGANTYAGTTTISRGTLAINADSGLGTAPAMPTPGAIVIDGGTTDAPSGATLRAAAAFTLDSNRGIALGSSGMQGIGTIDVTGTNATTFNTLTYNGAIADNGGQPGGLIKTGAGTLTLGGTNTYNGLTRVNSGALTVTSQAALGTTAQGTVVSAGATLQFSGDINYAAAETIDLYGAGSNGVGALNNLSGNNTLSGPTLRVAGAASIGSAAGTLTLPNALDREGAGDLGFVGNGDIVVQAPIGDPSFLPLSNVQGRLFLGTGLGINTSAGSNNINNLIPGGSATPVNTANLNGRLAFFSDADFTNFFGGTNPGSANFTAVFFGQFTPTASGDYYFAATNNDDNAAFWIDTNSNGAFDAFDVNQSVAINNTSYVTATLTAGTTYNLAWAVQDLGLGSGLVGRAQFSGNMVAPVSGGNLNAASTPGFIGTISKSGAGTLSLNGVNTFHDNLVVNAGTLAGTGTVTAPVTINTGSVAPGFSGAGVFNVGSLAVGSTGGLTVDINGTTAGTQYDQLAVTGTVNLGGSINVNLGFTPTSGQQFTVLTNDGSDPIVGTFAGIAEGGAFSSGGVRFTVSYIGGTGNDVVLTVANPTIISINPFVGPTTGGTTVLIVGANFMGASAVQFGGVDATSYTVNSASQITAVTPAGAAATVNVTVVNNGVSSSDSGTADDFTYQQAGTTPQITSVVVNGGAIVARNNFGSAPALAGQQSVVEQLLVTFDQQVTLDADAFAITSLASSVTASVAQPSTAAVAITATGVTGTGDNVAGYTQYVLTFNAGAGVNSFNNTSAGGNAFTTLKDGFFALNTVGAKVHGSGTTAADQSSKFWSLYGAVNSQDVTASTSLGDGQSKLLVDGIALGEMYATFGSFANVSGPPAYNKSYDWNLDGIVDGIDLGKMYANFGTIWQF